uniref:Uncharacterized protein n=1 Tax=Avena sativa TaxID=4498 RepID=A0ACD5U3W8_AVESA
MSRASALLFLVLLVGSLHLTTASLLDFDVIGIDLGTTYSRVAVYQKGHIVVVPDEQGNRATPSLVAFGEGGRRLVGEAAEDQHTANTIYGAAKRLLGRRFSDEAVQREIELLPYAVVDHDGRPHVRVQVGDGGDDDVLLLSPEEIVAEVLAKLKGAAEAFLGRNVTKAVITVPAYYDDAQRQATKDAGVIAGLQVLRVMNDPTAAAIAYGLEKKHDKKTLVFDLGGGTSDVTVVRCEDMVFDILSASGDPHLGGQDFDRRVADHFVEVIRGKHGRDISGDGRALRRLRRECEWAKRALSSQRETRVEVEALLEGLDFSERLTRAQFEELNEDLFLKAVAHMEKAVADAGLEKREIDHVILAGGSTRIHRVQQLVKEYFDGKEPHRGINPDETAAFGAAVQGSILAGHGSEEPRTYGWYTPPSLTIGIEAEDGTMTAVIPRNAALPTRKTHVVTTFWDKRSTVSIKVFEGERREAKDCRFMGQLQLSGIPIARIWNWGRRDIEVTMEADEDGELRVEATDKRSGKSESAIIDPSHRRIDRMFRQEEARRARDKLEAYIRSVMDTVDGKMEPEEEEKVEEAVDKARKWFDANPVGKYRDYEENLRELAKVCYPVVLAVHQRFPGGHDDDEL